MGAAEGVSVVFVVKARTRVEGVNATAASDDVVIRVSADKFVRV